MKKNVLFKTLVLVFFVSLFVACDDDDSVQPQLGEMSVELKLASGLSNIPLSNIPVKITNTVDNSEYSETSNSSGVAAFTDLPAGLYNIVVTQSTDEYTLSGTANNIAVTTNETTPTEIILNATNNDGGLVIKELYYAGADDSYFSLFKDQFIEIFNNSSETLYADGIYIANLFGNAGDSGDTPFSSVLPINDFVYASLIDKIPGNGTDYPIEAGKSIVIALNAVNYKEGNANADKAIDNTDVTLERYSVEWLQEQGRSGNTFFDLDNPAVPNMENVYIFEQTNFYRFFINGAAVVLVDKDVSFDGVALTDYDVPNSDDVYKLMPIPVDKVIDGSENLYNSQAANFKRLPSTIDSGFSYLNADGTVSYTGKSTRRKIDETATARFGRTILMDTNNSTVDFETIDAPDKYGYNN